MIRGHLGFFLFSVLMLMMLKVSFQEAEASKRHKVIGFLPYGQGGLKTVGLVQIPDSMWDVYGPSLSGIGRQGIFIWDTMFKEEKSALKLIDYSGKILQMWIDENQMLEPLAVTNGDWIWVGVSQGRIVRSSIRLWSYRFSNKRVIKDFRQKIAREWRNYLRDKCGLTVHNTCFFVEKLAATPEGVLGLLNAIKDSSRSFYLIKFTWDGEHIISFFPISKGLGKPFLSFNGKLLFTSPTVDEQLSKGCKLFRVYDFNGQQILSLPFSRVRQALSLKTCGSTLVTLLEATDQNFHISVSQQVEEARNRSLLFGKVNLESYTKEALLIVNKSGEIIQVNWREICPIMSYRVLPVSNGYYYLKFGDEGVYVIFCQI